MTPPTFPTWVQRIGDVLFYAGVIVVLSIPIGLAVSAFALPQPVPFVGDFDTWDTGSNVEPAWAFLPVDEFKRDLDVTNMRRTP